MPAASQPSKFQVRRRPAPVAMFVVVGLAFVGAVFLAAALGYLDYTYSRQTSAYDSGAICSSTADVSNCRYQGEATIVHRYTDSSGALSVDVRFAQLGGKTVTGYIDTTYTSQWQAWQPGQTVNAELWQGLLTKVDSVPTRGNPDALPNAGVLPVVVFGGGALAMVGAFLWLLWLNKRAQARPTAAQSAAR